MHLNGPLRPRSALRPQWVARQGSAARSQSSRHFGHKRDERKPHVAFYPVHDQCGCRTAGCQRIGRGLVEELTDALYLSPRPSDGVMIALEIGRHLSDRRPEQRVCTFGSSPHVLRTDCQPPARPVAMSHGARVRARAHPATIGCGRSTSGCRSSGNPGIHVCSTNAVGAYRFWGIRLPLPAMRNRQQRILSAYPK